LAPGVATCRLQGISTLIDRHRVGVHELNDSAEAAVLLLDGHRSPRDIANILVDRSLVRDPSTVITFLATLCRNGLAVELASATATASRDPFRNGDRTLSDASGRRIAWVECPPRRFVCGPFAALDFAFAVHLDDEGLAAQINRLMVALPRPPAEEAVFHFEIRGTSPFDLIANGVVLREHVNAELVLVGLLAHLNLAALWSTDRSLTLHGGVVELHDRAVAVLGNSGAGKSTLTTSLLVHGATYLSDEVVWLCDPGESNADFAVRPHPKPISLGSPPTDLAARFTPEQLREIERDAGHLAPPPLSRPGTTPVPLGLIVTVEFDADADGLCATRLTEREALHRLVANCFALDSFNARAAERFTRLAALPCWNLRYDDHRLATRWIDRMLNPAAESGESDAADR
jgi:hypothetical protein